MDQLQELRVWDWGPDVAELLDWRADRYSPRAELSWQRVSRRAGNATWYFPHWDVPWIGAPRKFVVTIHDLAHLNLDVSVAKRTLARAWIRRTTRRARRITTVSRFTSGELTARWPELAAKVDLIPNGVDEHFFDSPPALPIAIQNRLSNSNAPMMLSVGNLKRYKNLVMGPEVLSRQPDLLWVVVGEWFEDWRDVEARAQALGVQSRMIVLGRQDDDVLHALYHRANCLFFPSLHEGFGLPVVEALACGTPVVAGDAPGTMETLGDVGVVCRQNDPAIFAAGVAQAIASGRRDADKRRARAREFSWAASGRRLADILEQVHAAA